MLPGEKQLIHNKKKDKVKQVIEERQLNQYLNRVKF